MTRCQCESGVPCCRCVIACALLTGLAVGAKAVAGQFVYVYTRDKQTKDLKRITNFVADK